MAENGGEKDAQPFLIIGRFRPKWSTKPPWHSTWNSGMDRALPEFLTSPWVYPSAVSADILM
jgi:hypothetical protein